MRALCALLCACAAGAAAASPFATRVIAYTPGAGAPAVDPQQALGAPSRDATPEVPDPTTSVSVAMGGELVLGFDRPIINGPGWDFTVFGNAFYKGGTRTIAFIEPGVVEAGVDVSGNGQPDAQTRWYRIQGRPNPMYNWGGVDLEQNPHWGLTDVHPVDGQGDPLVPTDPMKPGISPGSAGGDAMDLDWAVDALGQPVALTEVHFLRITCTGTWSTEIDAVAILHGNTRTLSGRADLQGLAAGVSPAGITASLSIGQAGSTGSDETHTITLDDTGAFSLATTVSGLLRVRLSVPRFVPLTLEPVDPDAAPLVWSLANGDADGDGAVTLFDYLAIDAAFGASGGLADLDMDGAVTLFDYLVVDRFFGASE